MNMTTLTLQIDNDTVLNHLKSVLKLMKGVTIISSKKGTRKTENMPNETTIAAMKEAESGNDAGVVDTQSLKNFMASMV